MADQEQREAAWAAVHRPDTSSEELARISEAHPEFMPAIAAHPNAPVSAAPANSATIPGPSPVTVDPGPTAAVAQQQPRTFEPAVHPVFAQPTQYAAPPAYPTPGAYAAPGTYAAAGAAKLNSLAVVSLIVAAIGALASFSLPFVANTLYYAEAYAFIDFALNSITWSFAIVSGALAAIALNPRHGTRWRWAAYAALGAAGYALVSSLVQTVAGGIMSAFSLY